MMELMIEVPDDLVKGLLCSAFEGGSNYWIDRCEIGEVGPHLKRDFYDKGRLQDPKNYWHWSQLVPMTDGCELLVWDIDGQKFSLEKSKIYQGLRLMMERSPSHFAKALLNDGDAITADIFLQYSLFGEVVYG